MRFLFPKYLPHPLRARVMMWWRIDVRPSPLQREFNRGDPHGIVRQYADLIIAEIEAEDRLNNKGESA